MDECATAESGDALFAEVSERLRRIVPFHGSAWFATDPSTVMASAPARLENIESGHCTSFWERECRVEDSLLFRDLARASIPVGTLYGVTDDQPARSARYREFLAPQGYGDEMRAAFRVGGSTWGVVDIFRERDAKAFTAREVEIVQSVLPAVATALRGLSRAAGVSPSAPFDGPGTAIFDRGGRLLCLDEPAEKLFEELGGPNWATLPLAMTSVHAVVARAPAIAEGRDRGPAAARVRSAAGRWLVVHATCMRQPDGDAAHIALRIEPARSSQIAPIIVEAYGLTPREQEITRAVARGLSNPEIAAELFLSPYTVRDHLKAVFAKVGVASRGELVAKLFAEHYSPAMRAPDAAISFGEY